MGQHIIGTLSGVSALSTLYVAKVGVRNTLITDGSSGLWEWDNSQNPISRVIDYLPTVVDNAGGSTEQTSTWCVTNSVAPSGHYLTWYRNRVFLADPNTSKVSYSGTRQDLSVYIPTLGTGNPAAWVNSHDYLIGDTVESGGVNYRCIVNHTSATTPTAFSAATNWSTSRPMKPYENWNVRMDLSRTNPSNGGSMLVGDPNERLTGLWGTEAGLLVFKERSVYLWAWSDAAAPHEVDRGATITKISDGIGLVSHETIDQYAGVVIFYGQDSNSNYGVYTYDGETFTNISGNIKRDLAQLSPTRHEQPHAVGIIYDGWYYLAPQVEQPGGTSLPTLMFACNIYGGGWIGLSGVPLTSATIHKASGKLVIANPTDSTLYDFPSPGQFEDFGTTGIDWLVESGTVNGDDPLVDKKFRLAWVNGDSLAGDSVSDDSVPYTLQIEYEDGDVDTFTGDLSGRDTNPVTLSKRAQEATLTAYGTAASGMRLRDLGLGWRTRKLKNV